MKTLITVFFLGFSTICYCQSERKTIYVGYTKYQIEQIKILKKAQKEVEAGKNFCDLVEKYSELYYDKCDTIDFLFMSELDETINKANFPAFKASIHEGKRAILHYGKFYYSLLYAEKINDKIILRGIFRVDEDIWEGVYDDEYEVIDN